MRVAIIGANGQLGTDIAKVFGGAGHTVLPIHRDVLDVARLESAISVVKDARPDVVINTAAMHNVEACEKDPEASFRVNAIGAHNVAIASQAVGAAVIYISTDYVFDGKKQKPYAESDEPRPLNVHANSKLAGEHFVRAEAARHFVVRVSGLFGLAPCRGKGGRNFVTTMLKLARERDEVRVVDDEFLAPTYTVDVANRLLELAGTDDHGVYHVTSSGHCSWYDFAAKIFELTEVRTKLCRARPGEFPAKVPRPLYTVLDNAATRKLGMAPMPTWEDGLTRYVRALVDSDERAPA